MAALIDATIIRTLLQLGLPIRKFPVEQPALVEQPAKQLAEQLV